MSCSAREAERVHQGAEQRYEESPRGQIESAFDRVLTVWGIGGLILAYLGVMVASWRLPAAPEGRDPLGPEACRVAIARKARIAAGAAIALLGLGVFLAALTGLVFIGVGGLVLAVAVGWFAASQAPAMNGYAAAEAEYQETVAATMTAAEARWNAENAARVTRGEGVTPFDPESVPWPAEPHLTPEEATDLGNRDGWNPPEGSAIAALTDDKGRQTPAANAVEKVARDLKWGKWDNVAGQGRNASGGTEPVFTPWVQLVRVEQLDGGDARVVLVSHHASVGADELTRRLDALLKAWRVRAAIPPVVFLDHATGELSVTVTNQRSNSGGGTASDTPNDTAGFTPPPTSGRGSGSASFGDDSGVVW